MKVESVSAVALRARLHTPFSFGLVDRTDSPNVLVRICTDDGLIGFGEACPVPAFTAETQYSVVEAVRSIAAPALIGADPLDRDRLLRTLATRLPHRPFTLAAVDIALWDLAGKAADQPVSVLLGGRYREHVEVHGSVGWAAPAVMAETALQQLETGCSMLKLYAGRGELAEDLARIRAVRAAVPATTRFILDVNGLWREEQARRALPALEELGVDLLEQPLAPWDVARQARLRESTTIRIVADEPVTGPHSVIDVAAAGSADAVNIGLSKVGGLLAAQECATVARVCGLGALVGSVLELGIATAAGLHLAAAQPELAGPSYLVGPTKYTRDVTDTPLRIDAGRLAVPGGPGLGIDIDEETVCALDAERA